MIMLCIIITGLPASGKTYYTDWLIKELHKNGSVYHIFGDALAHCSYNCQYTEQELRIKYDVMKYQILQAKNHNYKYIVIDDLFKRSEDFYDIKGLFCNCIIIKLIAPLSVLIARNNSRPKYHRLSTNKMMQYADNFSNIVQLHEFGIEIDVSLDSRAKAKRIIMDKIQEVEITINGKDI